MQKPAKGETSRPVVPVGERGRFIGAVAVGKERYQVHLLELVGDTVVRREVLNAGKVDKLSDGTTVRGDGLAVTLANINTAVSKFLRGGLSMLWGRQ